MTEESEESEESEQSDKTEKPKSNELDPRREAASGREILSRNVYYAGQTILEQGATGRRAFYIDNGRVEVIAEDDGLEIKVAELGPGEVFGEMALIGRSDRSATVRALEETCVTVISENILEGRINKGTDKALIALIRVLADRIRTANQGQLNQYRMLAEFQDRISGLAERAKAGIAEKDRSEFRDEAEPLLAELEALLARYSKK